MMGISIEMGMDMCVNMDINMKGDSVESDCKDVNSGLRIGIGFRRWRGVPPRE